MSRLDVRDLSKEGLPPGKFPVEPRADFRLYISREVRKGIDEHAKADVTVEICGVLVGRWGTDENGPFASVTNYIRCANATSKFAEVTFTHESWSQINKEMDTKFSDERIIGWYHSHPDFGIFLSERDAFIQQHFFSGAGQVAYVVDPVRDLEGVFAWRDGKPTPLPHYWIGNTVRTVEASDRGGPNQMGAHGQARDGDANAAAGGKSWDSSPLGLATIVLAVLAMFLAGYLYGGWRAHSQEELIRREAVARLADLDLLQVTQEADMANVHKRLAAISDSIDKLPAPGDDVPKEQLKEAKLRRDVIKQHLKLTGEELKRAEMLARTERAIFERIVTLKLFDLRQMVAEASEAARKQAERQKAAAKSDKAGGASSPKATNQQPPPAGAENPPAATGNSPVPATPSSPPNQPQSQTK
jgi:proteasome lid subunit RPN8/RPN11